VQGTQHMGINAKAEAQ